MRDADLTIYAILSNYPKNTPQSCILMLFNSDESTFELYSDRSLTRSKGVLIGRLKYVITDPSGSFVAIDQNSGTREFYNYIREKFSKMELRLNLNPLIKVKSIR